MNMLLVMRRVWTSWIIFMMILAKGGCHSTYLGNCVKEIDNQYKDSIQLDELSLALGKLDDGKVEVQDPFEEVKLGGQTVLGYLYNPTSSTGFQNLFGKSFKAI